MAKEKSTNTKSKKDAKSANKVLRYFKDLKSEIKKVVWPTKKQIRNNTIVVLGFMAVAGVFIWVLDAIMGLIVNTVFK